MPFPKPFLTKLHQAMSCYIADQYHRVPLGPDETRERLVWVVPDANKMPVQYRRCTRALLLGLLAAWWWRDDASLYEQYQRRARQAERVRRRTEKFEQAKRRRNDANQWRIANLTTEICLGFFLACGKRQVSESLLKPVADEIYTLLYLNLPKDMFLEPERQACEAIRQRVRRLRVKLGSSVAEARSKATFERILSILDRYEKPVI